MAAAFRDREARISPILHGAGLAAVGG